MLILFVSKVMSNISLKTIEKEKKYIMGVAVVVVFVIFSS
jgi:hypothetical protein